MVSDDDGMIFALGLDGSLLGLGQGLKSRVRSENVTLVRDDDKNMDLGRLSQLSRKGWNLERLGQREC